MSWVFRSYLPCWIGLCTQTAFYTYAQAFHFALHTKPNICQAKTSRFNLSCRAIQFALSYLFSSVLFHPVFEQIANRKQRKCALCRAHSKRRDVYVCNRSYNPTKAITCLTKAKIHHRKSDSASCFAYRLCKHKTAIRGNYLPS